MKEAQHKVTDVTSHNLTAGRISAILENISARANNGRITERPEMITDYANMKPSEDDIRTAREKVRGHNVIGSKVSEADVAEAIALEAEAEITLQAIESLEVRESYAWMLNSLTRSLMGGK